MNPAWDGLTVEDATFLNYDRKGMVAVGGFAKALPPHGAGYDFRDNGGFETRFHRTKWVNSENRVRWRWNDEHMFTDMDGTFADQPGFCAGCHLLRNPMLANPHGFPDCYQDDRYDGSVCKPSYNIVGVQFQAKDDYMDFPNVRMIYRDAGGMYVREDDKEYLRDKWRPEGAYNLVRMDVMTDTLA